MQRLYLFWILQMGKGRTTTGMILACFLKDILFGDNSKTYYDPKTRVTEEEYPDEDEFLEEVFSNHKPYVPSMSVTSLIG